MQDTRLEREACRPDGVPARRLERFDFRELLGAGGMGVIYRAFDRRLCREVAVKLPRGSLGRLPWSARARLLREAQALMRVRHAHVVEFFDLHVEADLACIAMRPLDGRSLRGRAIEWRRAVAVGIQIGEALAAVHRAGLVHRDVSPDNILVDAGGRAWLIDFGLARLAGAPTTRDDLLALSLSPPGGPVGTPAYMAPEQRRGAPPDPAADQYALCATLRALLGEGAASPTALTRLLRRGLAEDAAARLPDMPALVAALRELGAA